MTDLFGTVNLGAMRLERGRPKAADGPQHRFANVYDGDEELGARAFYVSRGEAQRAVQILKEHWKDCGLTAPPVLRARLRVRARG